MGRGPAPHRAPVPPRPGGGQSPGGQPGDLHPRERRVASLYGSEAGESEAAMKWRAEFLCLPRTDRK